MHPNISSNFDGGQSDCAKQGHTWGGNSHWHGWKLVTLLLCFNFQDNQINIIATISFQFSVFCIALPDIVDVDILKIEFTKYCEILKQSWVTHPFSNILFEKKIIQLRFHICKKQSETSIVKVTKIVGKV